MSNPKIKFKRSSVHQKRPSLVHLDAGELGLNTFDGKLFTRQDTSGVGIGTTITLINPWNEHFGSGTIDYIGTVGIGTTNPQFTLDVDGDLRSTGTLQVGSDSVIIDGINNIVTVGSATTIEDGGINVTGVVTATSFDGNLATTNLTGTISNDQLAGSINNSKLDNSSISFGGVTLELGQADPTPAFNLVHAFNYPFENISGITTEIVGDTTPQLGGDLDVNGNDITGTGNINLTGDATFSGNVSIAGTLTYEDVTNVDSIGLITARNGVRIDNGGLSVTGVSTFNNDIYVNTIRRRTDNSTNTKIQLNAGQIKLFAGNGSTPKLSLNGTVAITTNTTVSGVLTANSFSGDGSTLSGVVTSIVAGGNINVTSSSGIVTISANTTQMVSDTLETTTLTVTGVTTLGGDVNVNGDIVTDVNVSGLVSATSLVVTGVTTLGIVTGATYFGDGSNLTGIAPTGSTTRTTNRFIATQGQTLFPATGTVTYDVGFVDVYLNGVKLDSTEFTATNGTTITLTTGASADDVIELVAFTHISFTDVTVLNDTSPQLGGDLDLNNNDITGTGNINITGDITATTFFGDGSGLTGVANTGNINADTLVVTGVTTLGIVTGATYYGDGSNLTGIIAGGSTLRTVNRYVATQGQTLFPPSGSVSYDVGFVDVYLNGGRLDTTEFTATDGTTVTLTTGVSVDDIVELVAFTNVGLTTANILTDTSPQLGGDLDLNNFDITGTGNINITGIATATSFSGDGSTLSGIVTSITAGNNISISGATGNVTITGLAATANINADTVDTGSLSVTGITTLAGNTNINGDSIFAGGIDVDGHTELDNVNVSGSITATTFTGSLDGNAGTATSLEDARNFSVTGDFVTASAVSFDGTSAVALAATITTDSIILGTYTSGDYVESVSGTANEIQVTSGTGEGSTPTIGFVANPTIGGNVTIGQDLTVTRDLQVTRNLSVDGTVTIGGTSATIFAETLKISDPDLVLGFRSDANGNDISNDTTASHGGVALASTEGSPLVNLVGAGETLSPTYKKIMWFKTNSFTGLNTDAWLSNYAFGVGTTSMSSGTKFAVGNIEANFDDFTAVRNINSSGIITATSFSGDGSGVTGVITATNADKIEVNQNSGNTFKNVVFVNGTDGNLKPQVISSIQVQPSTGILTATKISGDGSLLTGLTHSQVSGAMGDFN